MYPQSLRTAQHLVSATKKVLRTARGMQVVIVPPAVFLRDLSKGARSAKLLYGAQQAHFEKEGAFTGEVSMGMVRDAGASYVLVGHSERRTAGESVADTRKQVAAALAVGLKPILCVGEQVRDDNGDYLQGFAEQLLQGLADVPKNRIKDVLIAYEPVWAIGGEQAMEPNSIHEVVLYIRKTLMEPFGKAALSIPILYGGSVTEESAHGILTEGEVQGLLVGHVSVDSDRFSTLLHSLK